EQRLAVGDEHVAPAGDQTPELIERSLTEQDANRVVIRPHVKPLPLVIAYWLSRTVSLIQSKFAMAPIHWIDRWIPSSAPFTRSQRTADSLLPPTCSTSDSRRSAVR